MTDKNLKFGLLIGVVMTMTGFAACDEGDLVVEMRASALTDGEQNLDEDETVATGVEALEVTITEVVAHFVPKKDKENKDKDEKVRGDKEKPAWVVLSSEQATYDVMTLREDPAVLGYGALGQGKVTQIRLTVSQTVPPVVTIDGVRHEMTVPSGQIKLNSPFCVYDDKDTIITLDFDPQKSVTLSDEGYKLRPTIKVIGEKGSCK
jgi:hypothetical protein